MDLSEVCGYIIDNINEDLSPESLSMIFHYNKSYLMRKFKEFTGFTISEFINECRVYNSTDPLIYTDDSILKIALTNGFNSSGILKQSLSFFGAVHFESVPKYNTRVATGYLFVFDLY